MNHKINYNERSWAIDLIGHVKIIIRSQNRSIKDAGGEQTIRKDGGSLFPDVLIFGDKSVSRILQGWELKMPDTPINDSDFFTNAKMKANILGLDSFLLWNVSYAHLYIREKTTNTFKLHKKWEELSDINTRNIVVNNRERWESLCTKIIKYLNGLFDNGTLEGKRFIESYKSGGITSFILENSSALEETLHGHTRKNSKFKSEALLWGERYQSEYGNDKNHIRILSKVILSNWIGKFLFSHVLMGFDSRARAVLQINEKTTPEEALQTFENISSMCNFWSIFSNSLGLNLIDHKSWSHILELNNLLKDLEVGSIDQAQLSEILEITVDISIRKLRGQYPTPYPLAQLLVSLSLNNPEEDKVIDPCCGSGTIVRAIMTQKLKISNPQQVSEQIFSSDQDYQAIQITTFALARPELMQLPLRIFNSDAFLLSPTNMVSFKNPINGKDFQENLGLFDSIISNLPFVSQGGRAQYETAIHKVNNILDLNNLPALSKKSDISAYFPFIFHSLLNENGMLGVIITNSWLGTEWGDIFYKNLIHYYHLKTVITSGAGRWFNNSEVVTNILILEKNKQAKLASELFTDFVVLKQPLIEFENQDYLSLVSAQINLGTVHDNDSISINSVSIQALDKFSQYGLRGNAQFVECSWVLDLPLIKLKSIAKITRGERRGWDKMFFPRENHNIEEKYLRPVLLNSKKIKSYIAVAEDVAFCCSVSEKELLKNGELGAYNWIQSFKNGYNTNGKPLIDILQRPNMFWYEMSDTALADFVFSINFNRRIFIARSMEKTFANQRLVCINIDHSSNLSLSLLHAVLNSVISYFFIEGMSFGKGLGALDFNKDRFEKYMYILDVRLLSTEDRERIISCFNPLLHREVMDISDELESDDRILFDQTILDVFNIKIPLAKIYQDFLRLISIRLTANDSY